MSNHYKTGEILDIPQEHINAAKKGASGALGLIGAVLGGVAKTVGRVGGAFANTVKQLTNKALPFGKAPTFQQTRRIKPFHRDGVTYDTKMINDAFKQRFGSPKPKVSPPQQNVISSSTVDRASKMRNIER